MKHRLFVYGTLRDGESNHRFYLSGATREADGRLHGFRMYALAGYPFILPVLDGYVQVEVYLVDEEALARIDLLELYFGAERPENEYDRRTVSLHDGRSGFVYVYADAASADTRYPVEDGDWPAYRKAHAFGFCS